MLPFGEIKGHDPLEDLHYRKVRSNVGAYERFQLKERGSDIVSTMERWMLAGMLVAAGSLSFAADSGAGTLPGRSVDGNLDERARMQTIHAEMQRECGAAPGSARCQRLKREFRQEAKICQKRHHK